MLSCYDRLMPIQFSKPCTHPKHTDTRWNAKQPLIRHERSSSQSHAAAAQLEDSGTCDRLLGPTTSSSQHHGSCSSDPLTHSSSLVVSVPIAALTSWNSSMMVSIKEYARRYGSRKRSVVSFGQKCGSLAQIMMISSTAASRTVSCRISDRRAVDVMSRKPVAKGGVRCEAVLEMCLV